MVVKPAFFRKPLKQRAKFFFRGPRFGLDLFTICLYSLSRKVTILKRHNLKAAREAKKLTQTKLAKAVGVSQATYSKYELGKASPREATWRKLAAILGRPVDHLWRLAD